MIRGFYDTNRDGKTHFLENMSDDSLMNETDHVRQKVGSRSLVEKSSITFLSTATDKGNIKTKKNNYFFTKSYCVTINKNRLEEMILLNGHTIGFGAEMGKLYWEM